MPTFYAVNLPTTCDGGIIPWLAQKADICKSIKDYDLRYDSDGNPLTSDCFKYNWVGYYPSPESIEIF